MDQSLQRYFEDQFGMFSTPGWNEFYQHFENILKQTDSLTGVDSAEKLYFRQGQLDVLRLVVNWPRFVEQAYEDNKDG